LGYVLQVNTPECLLQTFSFDAHSEENIFIQVDFTGKRGGSKAKPE